MQPKLNRLAAAFTLGLLGTTTAFAQGNAVPGKDISLGSLGVIKYWGHVGSAYPNGTAGFSMATTACNVGTVMVGWHAPMQDDHPTIAFLFAREENGRFVQISDRSYLKHGFFATNQSSCGPCPDPSPNPSELSPGCSDTYSTTNNADHYYLGPPDEVDPWLGTWNSKCSHFDRGEPAVSPPFDCDNNRSLTSGQASALGPVGHRIRVPDSELGHAGASYYYGSHYMINGEPEANRNNNLVSREFISSWDGSNWVTNGLPGQLVGPILERWSGASLTSNTNGSDDGRLYIGVKVTGPTGGLYHYEFAVYNRDNDRGVASFRLPVNAAAQVLNEGFRDIDQNVGNEWTFTRTATEVTFSSTGNPLRWNSIFNFWFDSDAGPAQGMANLDQADSGFGLPTVDVTTSVPTDICTTPNLYCTAKVGSLGCTPTVSFSGLPSASAGSGFDIRATDVISSTNGLLFYSLNGSASLPFQGGTLCMSLPLVRTAVQNSGGSPPNTDCTGQFSFDFNLHIASGSDPSLVQGVQVEAQYWSRDINDPTGFGSALSDAVDFTICP